MAEASDVSDLRPGDHACLTFTDSEERLDVVAAFVRHGLRARRRVLCLTDALSQSALTAELSDRGLPVTDATSAGQMRVLSTAETFLAGGSFAADQMIAALSRQASSAAADGFDGLWITSDMCWALRPVVGLERLWTYEREVSRLLAKTRATSVCQYDRQCFDSVSLASAATAHAYALAAATCYSDALLRICRQNQPNGVRVSGEIDYRQVEPLGRALTETLAVDDHLHVNLTGLTFTDGSAAGVLMQCAASVQPGQRMTVRCRTQAGKVFRALGMSDLSGAELVVIDAG